MNYFHYIFVLLPIIFGCDNSSSESDNPKVTETNTIDPTPMTLNNAAEVSKVLVSGKEGNYTFTVTSKSPDTGCDQYADWWEIITPEGKLLYRRILGHSHVDEQPFSRSGGPVAIKADTTVIIRIHMNNTGYASLAQHGTVTDGFKMIELESNFANQLSEQEPLPNNCAF